MYIRLFLSIYISLCPSIPCCGCPDLSHCLACFVASLHTQDKEPRGIIPLENLGVRELTDYKKPHCLEIFSDAESAIKACKTDSEGKVVEGTL